MALYRKGGMMTASGLIFYPLEPVPEDIRIEDIAHGLAATNRFSGHTRFPYSVAQHSTLVSREMAAHCTDRALFHRIGIRGLFGLLHDASEAYLGDVSRPLKHSDTFADYRETERRLQAMIYTRFGLNPEEVPEDLPYVDRRALRTEQYWLMPPAAPGEDREDVPLIQLSIERWTFEWARERFLTEFDLLTTPVGEPLGSCRDSHG